MSQTKEMQAAGNNPFAMLLDLDGVVRDMQHSERLARLQRRICHPLDTPLRARTAQASADFDRMVDEAPDEPQIDEGESLSAAQAQSIHG